MRISFGCTVLRLDNQPVECIQLDFQVSLVQLPRISGCLNGPVDLHFNERVKDLDKFVSVDRLKKDLAKNSSFNMVWKIKVQNQSANQIVIYHDS